MATKKLMEGRYKMKKFLGDILRVNDPEKSGEDKYSLSRTSLLISTLVALVMVMLPFITEIDHTMYDVMTNTIILMIFLYAGYAFGGKVMSSRSKVKEKIDQLNG